MQYLGIPYRAGGTKCLLSIFIDSSLYTELEIEAGNPADFKAYVPLPDGRLEFHTSEESVQELISLEEHDRHETTSPYRLHFAPDYGWMNDPNGLHYDGSLYHMYFQYNPVSKVWGNMSWGHAVSRDLISWKQLDAVMLPPDSSRSVYSGSAIREADDFAVYYTINDSEDPLRNTQHRRQVCDNGCTLKDDTVVIGPGTAYGARDPRAFYYKGAEYIVMYLDGNDFALYRKEESGWVRTDTFSADKAWECPDILQLSGKTIFTSADGFYWIIDISAEGKVTFLSERRCMFSNRIPYASQTFSGTEGRTLLIPWLRITTPSLPSTGVMGIPRELVLDESDVLHLLPASEILALTEKACRMRSRKLETEKTSYILRIEGAGAFEGTINGTRVNYREGKLKIAGEEVDFSSDVFILITDGPVLEVSDGDFISTACFELEYPSGKSALVFDCECETELTVI